MNMFKTPEGLEFPLLDLKGKDYLQVCWRVVWFRHKHPMGQIMTERISESEKHVTYRATIAIPMELPVKADTPFLKIANADKTIFIKTSMDYEKAETGAIGRALALSGFGTSNSADDLDEGDDLADSPQDSKNPRQEMKVNSQPAEKSEAPKASAGAIPPKDQTFTIGKDIKGKKFSEKLADPSFLKWVNDTLAKEGDKAHKQLLEFHKFARAHGAYRI